MEEGSPHCPYCNAVLESSVQSQRDVSSIKCSVCKKPFKLAKPPPETTIIREKKKDPHAEYKKPSYAQYVPIHNDTILEVLRSVEEKQKVAPEVVEKMQNIIASKPVTQRDSKFDKGSRAFNFLKGMNKPVINISETSLWKKFLKACKKGNPKIVKEILQTHPNIANEAITWSRQRSGLHKAVEFGHTDVIELLLSIGKADVNIVEGTLGDTPLHIAARFNRAEAALRLLRSKASLRTLNYQGMTPWDVANFVGSTDVIKAMTNFVDDLMDPVSKNYVPYVAKNIENGLDPSFARGDGYSLLHHASYADSPDVLSFLISKGAFVNAQGTFQGIEPSDRCKDSFGKTPLHVACEQNNVTIVNLLVGNSKATGCDVNAVDNALWTPLHLAVALDHEKCVQELLVSQKLDLNPRELYHEATPLHMAFLSSKNGRTIELLLIHGASKEVRDINGMTPVDKATVVNRQISPLGELGLQLLAAVESGDVGAVGSLIARGANVNFAESKRKQTALHIAVASNKPKVVELLLSKGADLFLEDANKQSPVDLAEELGEKIDPNVRKAFDDHKLLLALFASVEIDDAKQVERLLQVKKVPPNTRNQNGYAPLHIAAEKGSSASIQVLAKAEDISIDIFSEEDGKTPLHLAAMNKRHNCVEALLANNANPHTLDKAEGYSALHWAAKAGDLVTLRTLLDGGADPEATSSKTGETPAQVIKENCPNRSEMLNLLNWHKLGRQLIKYITRNDLAGVKRLLDLEDARKAFENDSSTKTFVDESSRSRVHKMFLDNLIAGTGLEAIALGLIRSYYKNLSDVIFSVESTRLELMPSCDAETFMGYVDSALKGDKDTKLLKVLEHLQQKIVLKPANYDDLITYTDHLGNTPLHHAVLRAEECVTLLLARGADVLITNKNKERPIDLIRDDPTKEYLKKTLADHENVFLLMEACKKGVRNQVEKHLVEDKVDVNCENSQKETPLFIAAFSAQAQIVQLLLEHGADPNHRTKNEETPLHAAVTGGDPSVVWLMLGYGAMPVVNKQGKTPLELAKEKNLEEIAALLEIGDAQRALLQAAAAGNWSDIVSRIHSQKTRFLLHTIDFKTGETLIHVAIRNKRVDIVRRLIDMKCNLTKRDKQYKTPLQLAYELNIGADLIALLQKNEKGAQLLMCATAGKSEEVRTLVATGTDVNYSDYQGATALHCVAEAGKVEVCKDLIEMNANVNATDSDGDTPLHIAALNGHAEIIKILYENKADINRRNHNNNSSLSYALFVNNTKIIMMLINFGADVSCRNTSGQSPLMLACRHSDITTLELILNQSEGSNILEERDNEQQTPLFVATVSGNVKCLEALLKVKANPNVYNKDGITPLMYACGRGMVHAVKLLLAHKADPNAKSRASKMTALHFACHFGSVECVELLIDHEANIEAPVPIAPGVTITALYIAITRGHKPVIQTLFAAGSRYTETFLVLSRGMMKFLTRLSLSYQLVEAAKQGSGSIVLQILKQKGVNIDTVDYQGKSALYWAAFNNHPSIVENLLKAGANANLKNKDGETSLDTVKRLLVDREDHTAVKNLLEHPPKADPEAFLASIDSDDDDSSSDEEYNNSSKKEEESDSESEDDNNNKSNRKSRRKRRQQQKQQKAKQEKAKQDKAKQDKAKQEETEAQKKKKEAKEKYKKEKEEKEKKYEKELKEFGEMMKALSESLKDNTQVVSNFTKKVAASLENVEGLVSDTQDQLYKEFLHLHSQLKTTA